MTDILGKADYFCSPGILYWNNIISINQFSTFYGLFFLLFLLDDEHLLLVLQLDILRLHDGHIVEAGGTPVQLGEAKSGRFV